MLINTHKNKKKRLLPLQFKTTVYRNGGQLRAQKFHITRA